MICGTGLKQSLWSRNTTESWSELDREVPRSLQHVATSHKWVSQSQLNSHQDIHGNGLRGLAIHRQVANYHHSTMWHCFVMLQFRHCRKTCMTKKIMSHQRPLLLFLSYTHFMCKGIMIMVWSFTSAIILEWGEWTPHPDTQCAFVFRSILKPIWFSVFWPTVFSSSSSSFMLD